MRSGWSVQEVAAADSSAFDRRAVPVVDPGCGRIAIGEEDGRTPSQVNTVGFVFGIVFFQFVDGLQSLIVVARIEVNQFSRDNAGTRFDVGVAAVGNEIKLAHCRRRYLADRSSGKVVKVVFFAGSQCSVDENR